MKWLACLLLVAQGFAVEMPKDFGSTIHAAEMVGAKGHAIDDGRVILCAFLFADALGVLDKPQPWITVIHSEAVFDQHFAIGRAGVRVESSTSRATGEKSYWAFVREPNDYAYLMAVARVFIDNFNVPEAKQIALYNQVRAKFLLMVDVKQLEKKH